MARVRTAERVHILSAGPTLSNFPSHASAREGPGYTLLVIKLFARQNYCLHERSRAWSKEDEARANAFPSGRRFSLWVSNDARRAVNVERFFDNRAASFLFSPALFWFLAGETLSP